MRFLRHGPARRVILGMVVGVGAGALGVGLLATSFFHRADQRRGHEIAALQEEVQIRAATLEALRADLARTTAERDRTVYYVM